MPLPTTEWTELRFPQQGFTLSEMTDPKLSELTAPTWPILSEMTDPDGTDWSNRFD